MNVWRIPGTRPCASGDTTRIRNIAVVTCARQALAEWAEGYDVWTAQNHTMVVDSITHGDTNANVETAGES